MNSSACSGIQVSQPPVQSDLPLFDASEFDITECDAARVATSQSHRARLSGANLTKASSTRRAARGQSGYRSNSVQAPVSADPLKKAQRVARQLRRGEFDSVARKAAVNSLCQHLIDSLQSQVSSNQH